jgi:hypothetical protein
MDDKSTGNEQSATLTNYSHLNRDCMNRLEKTLKDTGECSKVG